MQNVESESWNWKQQAKKADYNYRLSCGAGTLSLEDEEFAGLGGSKIVDNDGAVRKMQLECGMGTLEVSFTE